MIHFLNQHTVPVALIHKVSVCSLSSLLINQHSLCKETCHEKYEVRSSKDQMASNGLHIRT